MPSMTRAGKALAAAAFAFALGGAAAKAGTWQDLSNFGANPGQLKGHVYIPDNAPANAPLVVTLHGCKQQARDYATRAGWTAYADKQGFLLLAPEQQFGFGPIAWWFYTLIPGPGRNHPDHCFNFAELRDSQRDGDGEATSIRQMIAKVQGQHGVDPKRTYVTGLSAGGGMTAVMLAAYPEVFAGGAIIAGVPYRCSDHTVHAMQDCGVKVTTPPKPRSPAEWGGFVRKASPNKGPWPIVSIWQGDADDTVNPANATELLEQWTDVHKVDRKADATEKGPNFVRRSYADAQGRVVVESYIIRKGGHVTPIDPHGAPACGQEGNQWIVDERICSTARIGRFWGLIP